MLYFRINVASPAVLRAPSLSLPLEVTSQGLASDAGALRSV